MIGLRKKTDSKINFLILDLDACGHWIPGVKLRIDYISGFKILKSFIQNPQGRKSEPEKIV